MLSKKLVELDEGGCSKEIDPVKLKRVATAFKEWLLTVDPNNDPFGFLQKDLPLVEAALDGSMVLPNHWYPHRRELGEGFLPEDFCEISAPFYNTIQGMGLIIERDRNGYVTGIKIIEKDGKRYAWMEFEDPPIMPSEQ